MILAAACFVLAMVVPTAVTTFGITFSQSGPHTRARGHRAGRETDRRGSGGRRPELCGAMSARMSVVILDRVAAGEFAQAIRGMCGVPAGLMAGAPVAEVQSVIRGIAGTGRSPCWWPPGCPSSPRTGHPAPRASPGHHPGPHDLTQPPAAPWPITYQLWMSPEHVGTGRVAGPPPGRCRTA